jgi:hypothetical protein
MDIVIDPKTKEVHVYSKTITKERIKSIVNNYRNLTDYEICIHNPEQKDSLIDVYEGNVLIDNLGNERK